jgi:hypothetical protein
MTESTELQPDEYPIGAALTVAYGSNERPFCPLADLYRILGNLAGHVPAPADINDYIDNYRPTVLAALPDELKTIDPPPAGDGETAAVA